MGFIKLNAGDVFLIVATILIIVAIYCVFRKDADDYLDWEDEVDKDADKASSVQ